MFFTTTEAALTGASPGSATLPVTVARKSWARAGPHSKAKSSRLLMTGTSPPGDRSLYTITDMWRTLRRGPLFRQAMIPLEVPEDRVQRQTAGRHINHARVRHQLPDTDRAARHSAEE